MYMHTKYNSIVMYAKLFTNGRMHNIVVHVCPMNFFYVFIVPGQGVIFYAIFDV
jgi:hypothetical protein